MNKINKGFCYLALILLQAQTLQAQDSEGMKLTSDGRFPLNDGLCGTVIYTLAQSTMLKRQDGESISEMMTDASKSDKLFGFDETVRDMTLAAYERPQLINKQNRNIAASDFAGAWTVSCYKAQR